MNQLKVGLVGLGRLGKRYADILHNQTPAAHLATVCSLNPEELAFAEKEFGISNGYTDLKQCLNQEQLDALFIVSSTDQHADHIVSGLEAGCHVFCEKPLSINIQECERVEGVAAKYPNQLAVIGFNRRHDPSYAYAKKKIEEGLIGVPFQVHSQTVDKDTVADFQIQYVRNSGGIFHDFNVHDIDLSRWYLGSEMETVFATGGAYKYSAFAEQGDADNVLTTCVFANGSIATIRASRIAMHGHDTYTEITGTEGTLRIGRPAQLNRVEIYDKHGIRKECVESFYDRFAEAFHIQIQHFISCVQNGTTPASTLRDATEATRAAEAFTLSFDQKKLVHISR